VIGSRWGPLDPVAGGEGLAKDRNLGSRSANFAVGPPPGRQRRRRSPGPPLARRAAARSPGPPPLAGAAARAPGPPPGRQGRPVARAAARSPGPPPGRQGRRPVARPPPCLGLRS
jgi:hypothetical protein